MSGPGKIFVTRLGFVGMDDDEYDGPELALQAALNNWEAHGHTVVGVSVLRSTRSRERYEAFVVTRGYEETST
jgi:hypothetical protein